MMEEVIISIPKRKIKLRTKNIAEAIKRLNQVREKIESSKYDILKNFAGIRSSDYSSKKTDWYEQ